MPSTVAGSPALPAPAVVDRLEGFLAELIAGLAPAAGAAGRNRGRPPILPATVLWAGLAVCVLRRATSQLDVWRLLSAHGLWDFPAVPVSDDAVYKRLEQDGAAAMEHLFAGVSALLVPRLDAVADRTLAPFAAEVFAIDETTLDPVARRLPALRGAPPGDDRLLPGKLTGVFDVRRQLWRRVMHTAAPRQNEKVAARDAVAPLPPGSLLLFDLGYFAFAWFDDLTDAERHWVSRLRAKTSFVPIHVFYADGETLDALVWLGAHRSDRTKHAVRLVQFRRGGTLHRYLTNVRDPHRLPPAEIARLYARRWDIEMAVDLAKTELGLHLLWSAKPTVILAQVWAVLLIAQIVQALRVLVAGAAGVAPFDVSLPLLVRYLPQYARRGHDPIAAFVADGRRLGFIRPSRRAVTTAPPIPPDALHPPPHTLVLQRSPRYAQKACTARPRPRPHPSPHLR
jgi:Transposase DDE domain